MNRNSRFFRAGLYLLTCGLLIFLAVYHFIWPNFSGTLPVKIVGVMAVVTLFASMSTMVTYGRKSRNAEGDGTGVNSDSPVSQEPVRRAASLGFALLACAAIVFVVTLLWTP